MSKKKKSLIKECKYCGKTFVAMGNEKYCSRECADTWRRIYGYHYTPNPTGGQKNTLCWNCKNATTGGCSWSDRFEPVEGWTATPTIIKVDADHNCNSFIVKECPLFEGDDK